VCFGRSGEYVTAAVYRREALAAGDTVTGPAVIEEYGATVPLHPGYAARVDRLGNLLVGVTGGAAT
jgi:N-methylhydantoinase A